MTVRAQRRRRKTDRADVKVRDVKVWGVKVWGVGGVGGVGGFITNRKESHGVSTNCTMYVRSDTLVILLHIFTMGVVGT